MLVDAEAKLETVGAGEDGKNGSAKSASNGGGSGRGLSRDMFPLLDLGEITRSTQYWGVALFMSCSHSTWASFRRVKDDARDRFGHEGDEKSCGSYVGHASASSRSKSGSRTESRMAASGCSMAWEDIQLCMRVTASLVVCSLEKRWSMAVSVS